MEIHFVFGSEKGIRVVGIRDAACLRNSVAWKRKKAVNMESKTN